MAPPSRVVLSLAAGADAEGRSKPYETRRALVISLVLIGLGVLGTFPLFFQAFGG
jgi:hypothetical protein